MVIKTSVTFLTMDSDELLIKDTGRILAGLTGNPAYPTPSPTLALVKTGLDEFTTALAAASKSFTVVGMTFSVMSRAR